MVYSAGLVSICKVLGFTPALQKVFRFLSCFSLFGGGVKVQPDIQHRRGKTLILTRKLTNPRGSLVPGCWPLWWSLGSSASSCRGISGSDWQCTQLGCSTGRWTHRGKG